MVPYRPRIVDAVIRERLEDFPAHTGPGLFDLGERITAAPISVLWS
jgi:hypothetical protein